MENRVLDEQKEVIEGKDFEVKDLNPWLMINITAMEYQTMNSPSSWWEWDND